MNSSSIIGFAVWLHRPEFGQRGGDTAAMDLFVIITLCLLFFLLGCFGTMAWVIWRRTCHPKPHLRLLMELEEDDETRSEAAETRPPGARAGGDPPLEAWERPSDWWQKQQPPGQ